ncbi:NETI motif-containing protein [Shouchella patagoniensis]|uniref:NETI motif-containing protein n=1 Tax=Bacillaceae TaxID=186817 RepID=UPI0006D26D82|nr:NETI motif-containing protein [Shouchella patagoniensis]
MKPRKQTFEVGDHEEIGDCLARMDREGYRPTRRMEKPVFEQQGKKEPVWLKQRIVFEGVLKEDTNQQV